MMKRLALIASSVMSLFWPSYSDAQSVHSTRPIRAHTIITADDVTLTNDSVAGAFQNTEDAIGLETRKTLYPGRPIMVGDLGPVTVIERNQLVQLSYSSSGLVILTDGRALGRGALGERIRVMNTDSRTVVSGVVTSPSNVEVKK